MTEANTTHEKKGIRIVQAPRQILNTTKKVTPYSPVEQANPPKNNDDVIYRNIPSVSTPEQSLPVPTTTRTTTTTLNDFIDESKATRPSTTLKSKPQSSVNKDIISKKQQQQPDKSSSAPSGCLSSFTKKQKLTLKLGIAALVIIVGAAAAVIPPVYLFVIRQIGPQSSFTNITVSACSSTTCIGQETPYHTSMVTVLYPFDGSYGDLTGYATGTQFGTSASFTTSCYVGYQALNLNVASLQYVQIPYVNLAQQSFTLQVWIYPTSGTLAGDIAIFGQCDSNSICLSLSLRNGRITLSFDSMNTNNSTLVGTSVFSNNNWIHVTIVYDAVLSQQQIYANGKIDAVSRGMVSPFQGTSSGSVTTIGRSISLAYGTSYYTGRIDHFTFSVGVARTANQILNDASLVAYYPFDTVGTFNDYSVNLFNGIAQATTTVSKGRVGQALYFPLNTSYFQAPCFPTKYVGNNVAFSISLWINPASTTGGGSLVHMSSSQNGSGSICYDLLAFTSSGALVLQWQVNTVNVTAAQGPIIPANTWTQVAVVYGQANGIRLYINGQASVTSLNLGTLSIQDSGVPIYVTLGTNNPLSSSSTAGCPIGPITTLAGSYTGSIDQFRLYNRELDSEELCVLANI